MVAQHPGRDVVMVSAGASRAACYLGLAPRG